MNSNKIFNKSVEDKFKKIFIFKNSNMWVFKKNDILYALAPAWATQMSLTPLVATTDRIIQNISKYKKIKNPEEGFFIEFDENYILNCDIRLEFESNFLDGWLYRVYSEHLKVDEHQKIWACSYLKLFYEKPPNTIFIKIIN